MKESKSMKCFRIINVLILGFVGISCLLPFINILAVSFSSRAVVEANQVTLWPKEFTTGCYQYILNNPQFWASLRNTLSRVILSLIFNLALTLLVAYPLSKDKTQFRSRGFYVGFFIIPMVFSGGTIPTYLVVSKLKLLNSVWALVLPEAVQTFFIVLMMNFFRGIPKAIEEAAYLDGASHMDCLLKIYLPLSKPSFATIALYSLVNNWNAWFDGLIYMNLPTDYPLMTYLRTVLVSLDQMLTSSGSSILTRGLEQVTSRSYHSALIMLCTLPILISYPFLQKYFVSGIVMGSVKE